MFVLSTLTGLALICALVAVLLGVTGGTALSPTHTPQRRPQPSTPSAPDAAASQEESALWAPVGQLTREADTEIETMTEDLS